MPEWDKILIPKYLAILLLTLFPLLSLVNCGTESLADVPQSAGNIYEQQYQMGLFLNKFYQDKVVVANDIGAINFLSDIKCIDLIGLGSIDIAKEKMKIHKVKKGGGFDEPAPLSPNQVADFTKGANIAIVYDKWRDMFSIPPQWEKVGEWEISNNIVCAFDTVSFYAIDPSEKDKLIGNLKQFSAVLPKNVAVM